MTKALTINPDLEQYIEQKLLPNTGISSTLFWQTLTDVITKFNPINAQLLKKRDTLQAQIDSYHQTHQSNFNHQHYKNFLKEIAYIEPEIADFKICPKNVDKELSQICAPQLVVPVDNARYSINAVNARFGNLYDALYGTDAISQSGELALGKQLNLKRSKAVFDWAHQFLDEILPLQQGSHAQVVGFKNCDEKLHIQLANSQTTTLQDSTKWIGFNTVDKEFSELIFKNHGLHIILQFDKNDTVGKHHPAGIKAILLESAVSTILDLEDSVAIVDAQDKIIAYDNLFQIINGQLSIEFEKHSELIKRQLKPDYYYQPVKGNDMVCLSSRSVILVRNVGIHMQTDMILSAQHKPIYESILDAIISAVMAHNALFKFDKKSFYLVKPKLHGSEEVGFMMDLLETLEAAFSLPKYTIKLGIMDEERRTSINLKQCIAAAKERIIFINTGFLDRTGDEIHTNMQAGAMCLKSDMKNTWFNAYEDRNVLISLKAGFIGQAQIGKGMWAIPDNMAQMLKQKITHPKQGASCAWVPSPTAATLHATHYHRYDVISKQKQLLALSHSLTDTHLLDEILSIPLLTKELSVQQIQTELANNIQSILGYVVRWIDSSIGCSKVLNIDHVELMEDRATLRISSQHIANWLQWNICNKEQIEQTFEEMSKIVDKQNFNVLDYIPMHKNPNGLALTTAKELVYYGANQANGYTEFILSRYRRLVKQNY